jgi:glycine cleavage system H lipoate-binding protein
MTPQVKRCHIIPPDELRCVWMSAGILSYQLCDRQFDCDHCPLDAAMRKRYPRRDDVPGQIETQRQVLRPDRMYSRKHCWAREIHETVVRVGIEPGLGAALLDPKEIVLPAENQRIGRGQACLWIVMEGGTLPVESPVSGIVRGTNPQLSEKPHLLRSQPLDHGWVYDLEVEESAAERRDLLTSEQAEAKFASDQAQFSHLLNGALAQGRPEVGVTMADGGQRLQGIADIVGPVRYFSFLRKVFG